MTTELSCWAGIDAANARDNRSKRGAYRAVPGAPYARAVLHLSVEARKPACMLGLRYVSGILRSCTHSRRARRARTHCRQCVSPPTERTRLTVRNHSVYKSGHARTFTELAARTIRALGSHICLCLSLRRARARMRHLPVGCSALCALGNSSVRGALAVHCSDSCRRTVRTQSRGLAVESSQTPARTELSDPAQGCLELAETSARTSLTDSSDECVTRPWSNLTKCADSLPLQKRMFLTFRALMSHESAYCSTWGLTPQPGQRIAAWGLTPHDACTPQDRTPHRMLALVTGPLGGKPLAMLGGQPPLVTTPRSAGGFTTHCPNTTTGLKTRVAGYRGATRPYGPSKIFTKFTGVCHVRVLQRVS